MTEVKLIHLKNIFRKYLEFILFFLPDSDVHDVWVSIISMFLELNYRVSSAAAAAAVCIKYYREESVEMTTCNAV